MKEYILWAVKKGQPLWMEEVIAETRSINELEKIKMQATENGFENLRVMIFNGEKPDFESALNI